MREPTQALMFAIDVLFVFDLVARVALLGPSYRRSPWVVVDVFAAAPIIASLAVATNYLYSLRFLRGFRVLRALRALRLLRALPGVRQAAARLQAAEASQPLPEVLAWHRALLIAVVSYSLLFMAPLLWLRTEVVHGRVLAWDGRPLTEAPLLTLTIDDGHGEEVVHVPAAQAVHGVASFELALVAGALLGMGLVLFVVRYQLPAIATRQIRALLNVALPHQVAEHFLRNPEAYQDTERAEVTVIFRGIEGWRALGAPAVQGKDEEVEVHEAFDASEPRLGFLDSFAESLAAWRAGDLDGAAAGFARADAQRAEDTGADVGDGPSRAYLRAIEDARRLSRPFQAVLRTRKA